MTTALERRTRTKPTARDYDQRAALRHIEREQLHVLLDEQERLRIAALASIRHAAEEECAAYDAMWRKWNAALLDRLAELDGTRKKRKD